MARINLLHAIVFATTEDGGLSVLGNTYLNARRSRITLIKLSKKQLIEFAH